MDVMLYCKAACWPELTAVCLGRSCMVEESGTLESQLEATKVSVAMNRDLLKAESEHVTSPGLIGRHFHP